MRLDMFLKMSRLIKRRPVAKQMCDEGRVLVGGSPAKAGRELRPGDIITLELPRRTVTAEVVAVPEGSVPKAGAAELYRIVEDRPRQEEPF